MTETAAVKAGSRVQSGDEFLESLRDGRSVWSYGERVDDVTTHPGFRNSARSLAELYDMMHAPETFDVMNAPTDTGSGGTTHPFFKVARSQDDLRASRNAITCWQERVFGWMGRTPDYKASLITTLGDNPEYFGEYADNARFWYKEVQERVLHIGHAIVNPPVDRSKPISETKDVFVHVDRETDNGLIVSGAKVVATGSPTTQYVYISKSGGPPVTDKSMALTFIAPVSGPGISMISRASYENVAARAASPFDYPLSSRLDENDTVLVFDEALIPWENVLVYDVDRINEFEDASGWLSRAIFQASTRMGVKLDFLVGAVSKALEITGSGGFRGVQAGLGEIISYRHAVHAIRDGMIESAEPGWTEGSVIPGTAYGFAYAAMAPGMYRRIREIIETIVASGLIYLNSNAVDFETPEIRPFLDRYLRGSNGKTALDRSKTMKLLWDAIGSEFGARHELYELNYFGQPETNHLAISQLSAVDGTLDYARDLVEQCMSEYDLKGWTNSRFVTPDDVNFIALRNK
ncbi:4-hydroxyphenylacetate 3-hydroxylase N-terminal domain-containing protein [Leucobacter soli]|uniref:4-nitrophenol 2-monooxygenase, oxygenase component n=1 Tax=Leucobacter soli TaxID=2812850 RepID=A0A916JSR8_9MICO|nr:4-hydroxyphenylacetate 3-hydroxylase N-terminal domain-containing protein [Leucobacter soli]CAG7600227.1 4-nitrophenol 2-monooxygenase, oxygenase component [Leucobacter soli]